MSRATRDGNHPRGGDVTEEAAGYLACVARERNLDARQQEALARLVRGVRRSGLVVTRSVAEAFARAMRPDRPVR